MKRAGQAGAQNSAVQGSHNSDAEFDPGSNSGQSEGLGLRPLMEPAGDRMSKGSCPRLYDVGFADEWLGECRNHFHWVVVDRSRAELNVEAVVSLNNSVGELMKMNSHVADNAAVVAEDDAGTATGVEDIPLGEIVAVAVVAAADGGNELETAALTEKNVEYAAVADIAAAAAAEVLGVLEEHGADTLAGCGGGGGRVDAAAAAAVVSESPVLES